jgi:hypothetical protein
MRRRSLEPHQVRPRAPEVVDRRSTDLAKSKLCAGTDCEHWVPGRWYGDLARLGLILSKLAAEGIRLDWRRRTGWSLRVIRHLGLMPQDSERALERQMRIPVAFVVQHVPMLSELHVFLGLAGAKAEVVADPAQPFAVPDLLLGLGQQLAAADDVLKRLTGRP